MSETAPPPPNPYHGAALPLSVAGEKFWATIVHIGGIFLHFLPALFGYFLLKDRGPFIREHTRSALNFQITVLFGYVVGFFTAFILIGFVILAAVAVLNVVFSILAAIAANRGDLYRYPLAIPFIAP